MTKKFGSPGRTKNATSTRPIRSTRGSGGQRAQLEKTSSIVGEGLLNKVAGRKRDRNNLIDVPGNLSENDLAPPIQTKRARITKNVSITNFFRNQYIANCIRNQYISSIGHSANQSSCPTRPASPSSPQAGSNIFNKRLDIWISCFLC